MKKLFLIASSFLFTCLINGQESIPSINIKTIDGKTISTQKIIENHPLVIFNFWATWCKPCHQELNALADLNEEWKNTTGVEIIAISVDDSRASSKVKTVASGNDWPFSVYLDDNNDLKRALNITNIPFLIIIKEGKIVHRQVGYTPGSESKVFEILKNHSTK